MRTMVQRTIGVAVLAYAALVGIEGMPAPSDGPQFDKNNQLIHPGNYREWIYLSSGLGMNYSASSGMPEQFTNVFVAPGAYRKFLVNGKWPDKTMFVLEERAASSKGSINRSGRFQGDLQGLAVSVKDEKRFHERWAYFTFSANTKEASAKPKSACWQCHNEHAAVDNTFVQFYPTLKSVAEKFGEYNEAKAVAHADAK